MASNAGEAAVAEPDPQEPKSAMEIARRPAPEAQTNPPVESLTAQTAEAKRDPAMKIARRPAPGAQRNPTVENLTTQAAGKEDHGGIAVESNQD